MSIRIDLPTCNLKTCKYNHNAYNCFDKKSYEKCSYGYVKDDLLDAHAKIYGRDAEIKQLKAKLERSVELPCKIGDVVYLVSDLPKDITRYKITSIQIFSDMMFFNWKALDGIYYYRVDGFATADIGKYVFLTRIEAEQKLRELEGK